MSSASNTAKPKWIPLESNPAAFNKYIRKIGVRGVYCVDVYGFDEELEFVPRPHLALLLCSPSYDKFRQVMDPVYKELREKGVKPPEGIFFMKQKISNACGTFSLFHAICQNVERIDIGEGSFSKWFAKAKALSVGERSNSLANDQPLAADYKECAEAGETEANEESEVEHHFIAFTNCGGRLIESDSSMDFPRDCGATNEENFLRDAAAVCKQIVAKLDGNVSFSAIALVAGEERPHPPHCTGILGIIIALIHALALGYMLSWSDMFLILGSAAFALMPLSTVLEIPEFHGVAVIATRIYWILSLSLLAPSSS